MKLFNFFRDLIRTIIGLFLFIFGDDEPEEIIIRDINVPNLYVSKKIGDSTLQGEVIKYDDTVLTLKIIQLDDLYFDNYLEINKTYNLNRYTDKDWADYSADRMLWEIDDLSISKKGVKILLYWEKNIGWTWELE